MSELQKGFIFFLFFVVTFGITALGTTFTERYPRTWAFLWGLNTVLVILLFVKLYRLSA